MQWTVHAYKTEVKEELQSDMIDAHYRALYTEHNTNKESENF
jgi:CRISPR/Cas system CMR subunit Cmr6 (Cas7 group RAMP superfamily)